MGQICLAFSQVLPPRLTGGQGDQAETQRLLQQFAQRHLMPSRFNERQFGEIWRKFGMGNQVQNLAAPICQQGPNIVALIALAAVGCRDLAARHAQQFSDCGGIVGRAAQPAIAIVINDQRARTIIGARLGQQSGGWQNADRKVIGHISAAIVQQMKGDAVAGAVGNDEQRPGGWQRSDQGAEQAIV